MNLKYLLCLTSVCLALSAPAASIRVSSPDRQTVFTLSASKDGLQYNLTYQKETLVQTSSLGFDCDGIFRPLADRAP